MLVIMSKRKPTSELNDRNWDVEEEPEEAGTFSAAGRDVLKNRVIRKAKRTVHTENRPASGSIFAGFALKTDNSSAASSKPALSTGVTHTFSSNFNLTSTKTNGTTKDDPPPSSKDNSSSAAASGKGGDNPEYLRQLKLLNENILTWIQKHVKENPYCILTPSFKDYERHVGSLEKKYWVQQSSSSLSPSSSPNSPFAAQEKGKAQSSPQPAPVQPAPAAASTFKGFQFEKKDASDTKSVFGSGGLASGFSFGQSSVTNSSDKSGSSETGGFKFGSSELTRSKGGFGWLGASSDSKPFSFSSAAKAATTDSSSSSAAQQPAQSSGAATGGDDEEYQPPKVEVKEIKEEGAVYSIRCKLFYQKAGQWTDRGVGNLHLKPTEDGRTQLVVRADTNLGNILLNIMLQPSMPTKRQGKNNVFFVCVPNPPLDSKAPSTQPTPMLIRVKTGDDADELLAKLEEMKA